MTKTAGVDGLVSLSNQGGYNMEPITTALMFGAGLLGSYLTSQSQLEAERRKLEEAEKQRQRARAYLSGYGYTPFMQQYNPFILQSYQSPLQSQQQYVLSELLSGRLLPSQEQALAQQQELGLSNILKQSATQGMTTGGRAALATQLARDLGVARANLATQNLMSGLQQAPVYENMWERRFLQPQEVAREEKRYSYEQALADYLRQQQAKMDLQKLLAQYA